MDRRTRRLLAGLALAAAVLLAGCGGGKPAVCGPCETDELARERGYDVETVSETVTIDVQQDGSARWTARLALTGNATATLAEDETLTRSLVRATFARASGAASPDTPLNLSVRVEDSTLFVGFDDPSLASRHVGGGWLVERFNDEPGGAPFAGFGVRVDEVVLRGPDGTVVVNRPASGRVSGATVTWRGVVDKRTYVAFGPDRSLASRFAAEIAVAAAVVDWLLWPTFVGALPAMLLLAGVGSTLAYHHRSGPPWREDLVAGRRSALLVIVVVTVASVAITQLETAVVGLAVVVSPVLVLAALGRYGHRGPGVRTGGLAALASLPVPVSAGIVIGNGMTPLTVIWAGIAVLVGVPLYLLGVRVASAVQDA